MYAHSKFVRGIVVANDGRSFFTCSDDKTIKQFKLCAFLDEDERIENQESMGIDDEYQTEPLNIWKGDRPFFAIDHHRSENVFVSASDMIQVWDVNRSKSIHDYKWGCDSIVSVKFNQSGRLIRYFRSRGVHFTCYLNHINLFFYVNTNCNLFKLIACYSR